MKSKILVMALMLMSVQALAAESSWTLEKKNSGPSSMDCSNHVVVKRDKDVIQAQGDGGFSVYFENVNAGRYCSRRQNGSIFGTLRCFENVVLFSNSGTVLNSYSCSSDLPFISSCNTRAQDPNFVIKIKSGQMTIGSATGWQGPDEGWFECAYRRSN